MSKSHGHHHAQNRRAHAPAIAPLHGNDNIDGPETQATQPEDAFPSMPQLPLSNTQFEQLFAVPLQMFDLMMAPATFWLGMMPGMPKEARLGFEETASAYIYRFPLPGIVAEQLDLRFHNDGLLLHVRETDTTERVRYAQPSHSYSRAFNLPEFSDAEQIAAALDDGMLTITIPKSDEPVASTKAFIAIV